ncbi:MAG: dTMP kinase [Alkaliphilus sp.]
MKSLFITIEGTDGAGKSTQIAHLKELLLAKGFKVTLTREPGGTRISEKIRKIILDKNNSEMSDRAEALLYAASRAQHVEEVIIPALKRGGIVICDRFVDSSMVYQGRGRSLGYESIKGINDFATGQLEPNLTILFDIKPEISLKRINARKNGDRLEREKLNFHQEVYNGYRDLEKMYPDRIKSVDANRSVKQIRKDIELIIEKLLNMSNTSV